MWRKPNNLLLNMSRNQRARCREMTTSVEFHVETRIAGINPEPKGSTVWKHSSNTSLCIWHKKGWCISPLQLWLTTGLTYKVLLDEQSAIVHIWRHSKEDVTSILIIILLKAYRNLEGKVRFYHQLFLSEQTDLCPTKCSQAAADP